MAACRLAPALAACAVLAGCAGDEPQGPAFAPTDVAASAPRPDLGETAPLRQAIAEAVPAAERLAGTAEGLATRSAALRGRAATLDGPVVDPARRERMLAAAAGG
jgi:hypothetical protein